MSHCTLVRVPTDWYADTQIADRRIIFTNLTGRNIWTSALGGLWSLHGCTRPILEL